MNIFKLKHFIQNFYTKKMFDIYEFLISFTYYKIKLVKSSVFHLFVIKISKRNR